ncbi:hypothetical protein KAJ38_01115 [Candidatus Pacearchaeota archaeon]|nr:hypothetical protein [Candidatus Pacearchaeota archaeon]
MNEDIKVRPYTWQEIKEFLVKELEKTKHIMTFGTIGSCDVEKDVDLIITKKVKSKTSSFYKEIHELFEKVNKYLNRRYSSKLVRFPGVSFIPEFESLFNYTKNDLAFHTMIYCSYPQIEKDWQWALFEDEILKDMFVNHYDCFFEDKNKLFLNEFGNSNYADNISLYLAFYDRINTIYDEKFLTEVMNYYFDYLFRKRLGLKSPIAKNKKDVKRIFYVLCDILDELNSKKKEV